MQRSDGTYDLPDEKVSLVWQSQAGQLLRRAYPGSHWTCLISCNSENPKPGRWLPWTPPVFPVRKKCSWRLCRVLLLTDDEHDDGHDAVWSLSGDVYLITHKWSVTPTSVKRVVWLTPEFEDELQGAQP